MILIVLDLLIAGVVIASISALMYRRKWLTERTARRAAEHKLLRAELDSAIVATADFRWPPDAL